MRQVSPPADTVHYRRDPVRPIRRSRPGHALVYPLDDANLRLKCAWPIIVPDRVSLDRTPHRKRRLLFAGLIGTGQPGAARPTALAASRQDASNSKTCGGGRRRTSSSTQVSRYPASLTHSILTVPSPRRRGSRISISDPNTARWRPIFDHEAGTGPGRHFRERAGGDGCPSAGRRAGRNAAVPRCRSSAITTARRGGCHPQRSANRPPSAWHSPTAARTDFSNDRAVAISLLSLSRDPTEFQPYSVIRQLCRLDHPVLRPGLASELGDRYRGQQFVISGLNLLERFREISCSRRVASLAGRVLPVDCHDDLR